VIPGRRDLEVRKDLLVHLELLEHRVYEVCRVTSVLQVIPEYKVLLVTLERLVILAFRVLEDLMVLRVPLDSRDLVVPLEPLARVDKKAEVAVKDHRANEVIQDLPEQQEQPEVLVCTPLSLALILKFLLAFAYYQWVGVVFRSITL